MKRLIIRGHMRSGTTILFRILSSLKNVHITHELCLYDRFFETDNKSKNLNKFIQMLYNPARLNGNNNEFSKINMKELEKTLRDWTKENPNWGPKDIIEKAESFIFNRNNNIIGDKDPHWNRYNELEELKKIGLKPKIIYTYRDGRDVVSSMYRNYIEKEPDKRPGWARDNPSKGCNSWVSNIENFLRDYFYYKDYYEILPHKYEDLLFNKEKASIRLSKFLDIDKKEILDVINTLITTPEDSHNKYYKEVFKDWEKFAPKKFKHYLHLLRYL